MTRDWLWLLAALLATATIFVLAFGLLQWRGLIRLVRSRRQNRRLGTAVLLLGVGLLCAVGGVVAWLVQTAVVLWLVVGVMFIAVGVVLLLQTIRAGGKDHE